MFLLRLIEGGCRVLGVGRLVWVIWLVGMPWFGVCKVTGTEKFEHGILID